jgi:hypothetical protein
MIACSARHEDEKVAMGYHKDAEALKVLANERPNPLNKVPKWNQIRIVQSQSAQLVRGKQETDVTLYEIAQRFMRYAKLGSLPVGSNAIQQITSAAHLFGKERLPISGLLNKFNSAVRILDLSENKSKRVKRKCDVFIESLLHEGSDDDDGYDSNEIKTRLALQRSNRKTTVNLELVDISDRKGVSRIADPGKS